MIAVYLLGTAVTVVLLCVFASEWQQRRRPVRQPDGHWRVPRAYHNGWGERR
jgi:hypothetical protein